MNNPPKMLGHLAKAHDFDTAKAIVQEHGAIPCGSGYYASVFKFYDVAPVSSMYVPRGADDLVLLGVPTALCKEARVIKIASNYDRGGRVTAQMAMMHPDDPLAPKVFGYMDFGAFYAVEMECLRELEDKEHESSDHGPTSAALTGGAGRREPLPSVIAMSPYLQGIAVFAEREKACWDIHADNVMMRGNQPVITDPISWSAR